MKSKISVLLTSLLLGFFLTACGGGGDGGGGGDAPPAPPAQRDSPGNIPGLGDTPGTIQGTPFRLPSGVEIVGEIGLSPMTPPGDTMALPVNEGLIEETSSNSTFKGKMFAAKDGVFNLSLDNKYVRLTYDASVGSGMAWLGMRIRNKNPTATTIVFPVMTIFKPVMRVRAQNFILLKEASVTIPPNAEFTVSVDAYCGNLYWMEDMYEGLPYEFFVVADSPTIKDLTDRLADKKINIEEYIGQEIIDYGERAIKLQDILHKLTDHGEHLSDEDKRWIEALPRSIR